MDLIFGIVAIILILALYAWGLLVGLDFGIRRDWPRWLIALVAGLICVYTPLWGPVYALGRWMGLWPKPPMGSNEKRQQRKEALEAALAVGREKTQAMTPEARAEFQRWYDEHYMVWPKAEILSEGPLEPTDEPRRAKFSGDHFDFGLYRHDPDSIDPILIPDLGPPSDMARFYTGVADEQRRQAEAAVFPPEPKPRPSTS